MKFIKDIFYGNDFCKEIEFKKTGFCKRIEFRSLLRLCHKLAWHCRYFKTYLTRMGAFLEDETLLVSDTSPLYSLMPNCFIACCCTHESKVSPLLWRGMLVPSILIYLKVIRIRKLIKSFKVLPSDGLPLNAEDARDGGELSPTHGG